MVLRFLRPVEWEPGEDPFLPGDEIHITKPTPQQQRWIRAGVVAVVRHEPELAVVAPMERR